MGALARTEAQRRRGAWLLAYFEVAPTVPDQAARVLQDVGQLAAAGFAVDPAEVSEKTGYRLAAGTGGGGDG
jgi:hypothetical protein